MTDKEKRELAVQRQVYYYAEATIILSLNVQAWIIKVHSLRRTSSEGWGCQRKPIRLVHSFQKVKQNFWGMDFFVKFNYKQSFMNTHQISSDSSERRLRHPKVVHTSLAHMVTSWRSETKNICIGVVDMLLFGFSPVEISWRSESSIISLVILDKLLFEFQLTS